MESIYEKAQKGRSIEHYSLQGYKAVKNNVRAKEMTSKRRLKQPVESSRNPVIIDVEK